jgi:hypothetical protein
LLALIAVAASSQATGLNRVRFVVVDPTTGKPTAGFVNVEAPDGRSAVVASSAFRPGETSALDGATLAASATGDATTITIPIGASVTLIQRDQVPTKEITIRVTATRLMPNKAPAGSATTVRNKEDIQKFVSPGQQDAKALTKGQAGVAEDSAGQAHVRGEHGDISYVVDGVPLPDTLSGRQGSVVVSSTIQSLEIITGGFAPEFGGLTAAVLNVTTLGSVAKATTDYSLLGGSYDTLNGDLTSVGPLGRKASYVLDLNASRTRLFQEPQQPDDQDAHNSGSTASAFVRLRYAPSSKDAFSLTLSGNPADIDIPNRTGLPSSFRSVGQGFGLFGMRNADGTRPDVTAENAGTLGSDTILLPSQQKAGQDIVEKDTNEFSVLSYNRLLAPGSEAQFALTILHSGQDVTNGNPATDLANLPVDSSIEFSPTVYRNVHHVQLNGNVGATRGKHRLKAGFLYDAQSGVESYQLVPGSQLALDALAVDAPGLAPAGTASATLDVNGNPIYTATGPVPTVLIERKGYYAAAYLQDTWSLGRLVANYGLRGDWYSQNLNDGVAKVDKFELSPRLNLSYDLNRLTQIHLAYNHLLNTPPIAQGALLGQVIEPEILDQYDASISRTIVRGQKASIGYYYKQIRNQFDTGLLIPGSQIGIYSTVSLERAGVHGVELSYDISAPGGIGWDGYLNYSYSAAKPKGLDNLGEEVGPYNDHDQRQTLGAGLAYTLKSGASAALTYQFGSGLASSVVPPSEDRTPRDQLDLKLFSGNVLFGKKAGLTLDVQNLLDSRKVINFESAFSGTRFQMGRRITLGLSGKF